VLTSDMINAIYTPVIEMQGVFRFVYDYYGMGLFIEELPSGLRSASHGGQGSGWMTHFQAVPETGDGIVILTNSQRSWPVFAYILTDWAHWCGFSSIGMSIIIPGQIGVWIFIGLLLFVSMLQSWRILQGLLTGQRKFSLISKKSLLLRLIQGLIFIVIVAILVWAINQPYLFIHSIFPIASGWIGTSFLLSALVLLFSLLFPFKENGEVTD